MKTIWKVVIILIAAGLVLSMIAVFMGASRWIYWGISGPQIADTDNEKRITELDLAQIENIEIRADYSDIEFIKSDKCGLDIRYFDENITWSLDNGNLSVTSSNKDINKLRFFDINLSFTYPKEYIKVYLPDDIELGSVSVKTSAGDMKIGGFSADDVQIKSSYGNVDVYSITCNKMQIELSAGDFSGKNLTSDDIVYKNSYGNSTFENATAKNLSINCSAGDITLNDSNVESITVRNDYGNITANNLITIKTDIKASAGDIKVSGEFSGQTVIHNSYGNIRFTTSKVKEDYTYDISTSLGDVTIDDSRVRGSTHGGSSAQNSLYITNSAGDIQVYFAK